MAEQEKLQRRGHRMARRIYKDRLQAHSVEEANRIAAEKREQRAEQKQNDEYAERSAAYQRSAKQLYKEWLAGMTPEERQRVEEMGLGEPDIEEPKGQQADIESRKDLPEVAISWDPSKLGENVAPGNVFADTFCACLAWCSQSGDLVPMGRRFLAMVAVLRPDLVTDMGFQVDRALVNEFNQATHTFPLDEVAMEFKAPLEWARRATSISRVGQRVYAMLFVLRPRFIASQTLEAIGELSNRTRQAVDKDVCDFRDTHAGMRGELMREEDHRLTCQTSQLLGRNTELAILNDGDVRTPLDEIPICRTKQFGLAREVVQLLEV